MVTNPPTSVGADSTKQMLVVGPAPFFFFFPVSFSLFPNPKGINHGIPTDTFPLEDNLLFTKKEKD